MEPTITLTFAEAFTIGTAIAGVFGFLIGQLTKRNVSQKLIDHVEECLRYREMMNKSIDEWKENTTREFSEVRKGIEGLYKKPGWFG